MNSSKIRDIPLDISIGPKYNVECKCGGNCICGQDSVKK